MFRAQRLRRAVDVAVKTLPRALFKAPLGEPRHSTTDGKGATGGRRMNEEEARKATWRCGKRTYGQTSERASERAIDSVRARARGDLRVKNDTRGFSLSELCRRLRSLGFLGDATDETDNYRNRTPRHGSERPRKEREMLSFKPLVQFRFATSIFLHSRFLLPSPRSLERE